MPRNWPHALLLFRSGRLSGDDLILFADQCAKAHSDEARRIVKEAE